eukprot:Gregarina_sp_Poly_1__11253@NODE_92_length_14764_cov_231_259032_g79_i0_p12_GENE_NODE_92_length_14764_cov_231_259032_g79_i0NODE_92_length_14764_cov_231_259032_g79_i0_p12_ORF_typecomplete_len122_score13_12HOOK/PF05622_12/0_004Nsp1_C/PF05064_13/0_012Nsp1_C/PF05064_13/3_1e02BPS1/PF05633_11/0_039ATG16/PF08614_11/0_055FliJ/PF02050_16/0_093SlyX/PF04102_12/0_12CCDC158/PF15921_5/0_089DUF16/PF01519_16/0_35_NODE_92_length_14764_cov_231_259032_g79_i011421507
MAGWSSRLPRSRYRILHEIRCAGESSITCIHTLALFQEWMGRVKKYKLETVQQGERIRRLEVETKKLKAALDAQTLGIEEGQQEIDDVFKEVGEVDQELKAGEKLAASRDQLFRARKTSQI